MNAALEFWLFLTLIAVCVIAALSAALYPLMRRGLRTLRPATRADILLGWALAPIVLGTVIAFSPWVLSALHIGPAECGRLSDSFLAICGPDCALGRALPIVFAVLLMAPFAWFVWVTGRRVRQAMLLNGRIGALVAVGETQAGTDVAVIASDEPLAFAAGWRRCRIIVASCLQRKLSDSEMRTVLAHERAHVARRDIIRHFLAETGATVHLPWVRAALLCDLRAATEQACDEVAARVIGDRLSVAETLLRVERVFGQRGLALTAPVHLLGGDVPARVEALLAGRAYPADRWRHVVYALAMFLGAAAIAAATPLHELTAYLLIHVQN